MVNANLTARVAPRELAIVAYHARMTDASIAEVGRYAILRLAGYSHDDARERALSSRSTPSIDGPDRVIGFTIPKEWLEAARENVPGDSSNTSHLFRYSLARLTSDDQEAIELATRRPGPRRKESAS